MGYFRDTIEQMEGYTPGFQPKSTNVVKLNTNENPYPPSPKTIETVRALTGEQLRRYPPPNADTFRNAAASVLGIRAENIICTNGGDDLLTVCFRAFCDSNRPVAYARPTYSLYPVLAQLRGCPAIEIERDASGSLDRLAEVNAAMTIVCNPNAPTTDFLTIDSLAALAEKLNNVLLIDEAYVDFAEDNAVRLINDFDNVLILRSMSKGYSLAGMRFGFGIGSVSLINGLMKAKDSYPVDVAAITVATAAIQDQPYFKSNVEKVKSERARLTQQLKSMGFDVADSRTNFVLARCVTQNAKEVFDALVKRDIFVRYFALPGLEDKLRITVGTSQQNDTLLGGLKEITG